MTYFIRKRLLCLLLLLFANQTIKSMETIKNVIACPDKITAATQAINNFGDKIVDSNIWDHVTNLVFFKLFGCISAAAGFATLHQWLKSLNNNKKLASGHRLPVKEPEIRDAKKVNIFTSESMDQEDHEELTQDTCDKKKQKIRSPDFKNRARKILPLLAGSLFTIIGLVFILKASSISSFFLTGRVI